MPLVHERLVYDRILCRLTSVRLIPVVHEGHVYGYNLPGCPQSVHLTDATSAWRPWLWLWPPRLTTSVWLVLLVVLMAVTSQVVLNQSIRLIPVVHEGRVYGSDFPGWCQSDCPQSVHLTDATSAWRPWLWLWPPRLTASVWLMLLVVLMTVTSQVDISLTDATSSAYGSDLPGWHQSDWCY